MELIMRYVNGGVRWVDSPAPIRTKKALREAVKIDPSEVTFYPTAAEWFGPETRWEGRLSEVPVGVSLSICGPDPYTRRSWYAQVSRSKGGKVAVS
jgi:hypothetical protein